MHSKSSQTTTATTTSDDSDANDDLKKMLNEPLSTAPPQTDEWLNHDSYPVLVCTDVAGSVVPICFFVFRFACFCLAFDRLLFARLLLFLSARGVDFNMVKHKNAFMLSTSLISSN